MKEHSSFGRAGGGRGEVGVLCQAAGCTALLLAAQSVEGSRQPCLGLKLSLWGQRSGWE